MAVVLAELREMLESEIDEQDELVFQVDKLGLEFCESSPHDSLATITLSQILDVFEILTKNEDPESSRRLSAYLFTRPNTMKRFEFLMEGATVGNTKLEDVAYYFEPPGDGSPPMEFDVDEIYGEEIDHFEALGEADEPDAKNEFVGGSDVQDRDVGTANDNAADLYGDDGVDYSIGEDKIVNDEGNADISSLEPAAVGQGESICETGPAKTAPQHDAGFDPNNTVSQAFADHDDDLIDYSDDKIADLTETRHDQRAEGVPDTTTTSLQVDGPSQQDDDLVSYADDKISVSGATSHGVGRTSSAGNKSSSPGENGAGINCGDEKMEISGDVASIGGDDAKQLQVEEIAIKNVEEPSQHGFEETDLEVTSYHGKEVVDGSSLDQFNQPLEIMMTSHDAASNAVVDALPLGPVESLSSGYRSGEKVTTELDVSVADESTRVEHIRNPSDMSIAFTAAGDESVRAAGANSGSGTSAELEVDPQAESAHAEGMPSLETESHIAVATITPDLNTAMAAVVKDDELGAMMGTNLPGNIDELSEIDWQDDDAVDVVTDMAEVLPSATKRGCPGVDEDDRNDVKRRRS
ncbi:hypothetical protein RJ55_00060 [Drechmeria coniospora]|nr:hypothetical protein RJ55_00060 [Drechmeria coniospora]